MTYLLLEYIKGYKIIDIGKIINNIKEGTQFLQMRKYFCTSISICNKNKILSYNLQYRVIKSIFEKLEEIIDNYTLRNIYY